jgi:hypothetical protein
LVSNYTYFNNFFEAQQEGTLFNVLHLSGSKLFRLSKRWSLLSEVHLQKETGGAPVNIPLFFTNNRINLEANLYKNLYLATGLEVRYHTPYKPDNYSPFLGQYFYQENFTVTNRPVVNAFFDFNIKSFKAFVRAENLNALRVSASNVGFTKENISVEHYPNQGLWIRLGIWWTFVN